MGKIELQILKGELIDRRKANADIFKLARAERDAWLNWPAQVAAELDVDVDVDVDEQKFHIALEGLVRDHLNSLICFLNRL